MEIIQGCYAGKIESGKGKLTGLRIATEQGDETVYLPKALRAIAQAELTLNEPVRVWVEGDRASKKKRYVLQLVPLAPKSAVSTSAVVTEIADDAEDKQKAKKKASKQTRKKKSEVTVQICQKKSCCKKGGDDLWAAFEAVNAEHTFKLEPVGCLGGCNRGPNIRLLPDNVKYRHVQLAEIDDILQTHRA
ncbi:MAG: hypothetical protein DCF25_01845 [Leptolyngbya foveolarum]|uniref:(2Fe-2S) ferredoxin domain-containing protein n=1 Tax=Leptolyngbya foveolarum TaxID=47253 RepID=A0A2W4UU89_9CYAN|nr:MAG: hypothetical protein DCF25_01845 [Leptolyngbya foveolarum]